jgi:hypothetical protein
MEDHVKRLLLAIGLTCTLLMGCVLAAPRPASTVTPAMASATPTEAAPATRTPVPPATAALTRTPVPTTRPAPTPDWADLSPYRQAMRPAFAGDVDRLAGVTRYWIDVYADPDDLTLRGTEQVHYTNHEDEPLGEIVFRLLPNTPGYGATMAVETIVMDGAAIEPRLSLGGSAVTVPLAEPLAPGESVELTLAYSGTLPTDRSAGYAQYGYIDGVLALPNAYPLIPVYDDEGWNVELAPAHGDATFSDVALYALRVTLPTGMVLATSGAIVDQADNADGTTTTTAASGPMRDFVLVASEAYETARGEASGVQVTSYYLGDEASGQRALDYAIESLRIYEERFGPYPYNELDVVATPTEAGGIEYPGLIVVAAGLYGEAGGFFELATVHEVAHQWWYGLVGSDQLDEPWLDEALAQYTSLLYYEDRYGPDAAQGVLESVFERPYQRLLDTGQDMPVGLPVAAYSEALYGAVVYGKGPLFFHEMRQQVGDEAFDRILRAYFEEHLYGIAYPQDLLEIAERVSGQELDALYAEWVLGK